jgi:hypothetical protein
VTARRRADPGASPGSEPTTRQLDAQPQPAALAYGPGHLLVHANPAFKAAYGSAVEGLPAAEALLGWPPAAFALLDLAYREGRALAYAVTLQGRARRLVMAPLRDVESGEVYGLRVHVTEPKPAPPAGTADDPGLRSEPGPAGQ